MPGDPSCQSRGLSKITKSHATQTSCLARAQHKLSGITTREGCLDSLSLCKKQLSPAVSTLKSRLQTRLQQRADESHITVGKCTLGSSHQTQHRGECWPPTCQEQPPRSRREAMPDPVGHRSRASAGKQSQLQYNTWMQDLKATSPQHRD